MPVKSMDNKSHQVTSAKYLPVNYWPTLDLKDHINSICHTLVSKVKSSSMSNLIKSNCYKIFVRPIVEYAVTVWSPHLQYQIYKSEKCSLFCRFISINSTLDHLSWPTLEQRRKYFKRIMFFKLIAMWFNWNSINQSNSFNFWVMYLSSISCSTSQNCNIFPFFLTLSRIYLKNW